MIGGRCPDFHRRDRGIHLVELTTHYGRDLPWRQCHPAGGRFPSRVVDDGLLGLERFGHGDLREDFGAVNAVHGHGRLPGRGNVLRVEHSLGLGVEHRLWLWLWLVLRLGRPLDLRWIVVEHRSGWRLFTL
jgi:hypothetical protein